jgi:hypothetical protein
MIGVQLYFITPQPNGEAQELAKHEFAAAIKETNGAEGSP